MLFLLHMAIVYVVSFVCTMVGEQVHVGCEEVAELMVLVVIPIVILLPESEADLTG